METKDKIAITVQTTIKAPIDKVWKNWTNPDDIVNWNNASEDWHTPRAENDLRAGGRFLSRMEAKDGSRGFDFTGTYDAIKNKELIEYTTDDSRKVKIQFMDDGNQTKVIETFEAENENPIEMQRGGWQAILDNFKNYTETNG
ncbi:SRPBCC family protein [Flavobacterium sp.]|uniref:SRPBCC family protein n=1 Tax=Flavobacterium sp. TaxID=239 RepID=UPI002B4B1382|nr:SRPBCC family protein [Flavobacterium sp.]HLF53145.1 SRPBCC family protein [Flavobacterium sp.]